MKWRRLGLVLARVAILFAVSAILVGGFWFHAEFYKLGLPVVLVAGSIMVIVVIMAFRFGVTGEFHSIRKPKKSLQFELADIGRIRHGVKTSMLRKPQGNRDIRPGRVVNAKVRGVDATVCRLRVVGIDRKYLEDLDNSDMASLGMASKAELSDLWTSLGGRFDEDTFVELVHFRLLETERTP